MRHNREIYAWEQDVYSSFFRAHPGVRSAPLSHENLIARTPGPRPGSGRLVVWFDPNAICFRARRAASSLLDPLGRRVAQEKAARRRP
jgi:hypothetical protein